MGGAASPFLHFPESSLHNQLAPEVYSSLFFTGKENKLPEKTWHDLFSVKQGVVVVVVILKFTNVCFIISD